jgi:hypothetical protein
MICTPEVKKQGIKDKTQKINPIIPKIKAVFIRPWVDGLLFFFDTIEKPKHLFKKTLL